MTTEYQEVGGRLGKMSVVALPFCEEIHCVDVPILDGHQVYSVEYRLDGIDDILVSELIGRKITISYSGAINCVHCGRKTKKSFNQGFCYPCFQKLARCDNCIVSPEKCHFHRGTCREPEWGEQFCMQDHYVYLANSSGLKVGITRGSQLPTRWIDQGAMQALPVYRVKNRLLSGLVETAFKTHVADKTNWRALLKGYPEPINLYEERERLMEAVAKDIEALQEQYGLNAITVCDSAKAQQFVYPVSEFPQKIVSHNLDKNPIVEGLLKGVKGQYLILDSGVINLRKYGGYHAVFGVH